MRTFGLYFTFCAITYLFFRRKKSGDWKERKRSIIYILYWFGRTSSFSYVPVRDQNLVVRGRNYRSICFIFILIFLKSFKIKRQVANKNWFVFFILKEKWLKVELKLIWNLIKKENKKNDHLIENQGLLWKYLWIFGYLHVFVVFEY